MKIPVSHKWPFKEGRLIWNSCINQSDLFYRIGHYHGPPQPPTTMADVPSQLRCWNCLLCLLLPLSSYSIDLASWWCTAILARLDLGWFRGWDLLRFRSALGWRAGKHAHWVIVLFHNILFTYVLSTIICI